MKKLKQIFGLFVVSFLIGYGIILQTTQWSPVNRDPAAIRNVFDFSNLSGADLNTAIKRRLLAGASVVKKENSLGVELGHFAMQGFTGGKSLACREYQTVTLGFNAEGTASSGEKPSMEIEGACEFSPDMTKINPIFIPVDKVLHETVSDGELQFRDGKHVTVRFKGMTDEWPSQWLLTSVKLSNQNHSQEIFMDAAEIKSMISDPIIVNFK